MQWKHCVLVSALLHTSVLGIANAQTRTSTDIG
jgi:hypothetical protein